MEIKLGYEVETGEEVDIQPSHLIVTGITQLSGKTTTLEALIQRSGLRAIVFKTKIGEKSFTEGTEIPPFFRDRSDYEFVKSLIEAYAKEKLIIEKGTLMRLCKGSASLVEIKKRVDEALAEGKLRGLKEEIHTRLQHYLENLIPQIQYANLSKVLTIYSGINIMNLDRFTEEAQSLIIQSVADEVLKNEKNTIIVIPEAWKFIPQKYNNPCKRTVESIIRQGAANNNYIWIDSQDMAGVDKTPLKQISTWILGYQAERNEVKHTLDQISLPKSMKPKEDEIMTLRKGHFYVSTYDFVKKVYVQPSWLDNEMAIGVSKGIIDVDTIEPPDTIVPHGISITEEAPYRAEESKIKREIIELRADFFNKIEEIQTAINKIYTEIYNIKTSLPSEEELIGKVLQKVTYSDHMIEEAAHKAVEILNISGFQKTPVDIEHIVKQVLTRIPSQGATYEVVPPEALKKEFQREALDKLLSIISVLDSREKKILKYVEGRGVGVSYNDIVKNALFMAQGGANTQMVRNKCKDMAASGLVRIDTRVAKVYPHLRDGIQDMLGVHGATAQDVDGVYNKVLYEMLEEK